MLSDIGGWLVWAMAGCAKPGRRSRMNHRARSRGLKPLEGFGGLNLRVTHKIITPINASDRGFICGKKIDQFFSGVDDEEEKRKKEEDIKLPYIPKDIQERLFDLGENDKMGKMFVSLI